MASLAELTPAAIPPLVARGGRGLAPRQRLTVSQWADAHRWISSKQSGEPGQWRTDRNPILGEIMDAFSPQNPVREIWVMKSSQCGVTEATVNVLGYTMHHAPCPVMVFMPTEQERDKWKAQKLNPMLLETECIREILGGLRSRDAANRADMIDFPGGIIFLAGGNSPNSYAQKSAKVIIVDDFDRFPTEIGEEGDPEGLVRGRAKAFPSTYKIGFISTPTIKDASLIERGYLRTDRRHYHVRCPHCGHSQRLVWQNLKWEQAKTIPTWAEYECEECGRGIGENHKPTLLRDGLWVPEAPEILTRRGYHITALTAPIGLGPSWLALAQEFLVAKSEPGTLKTFINQNLGEPWEDQSGKLKSHELARRMSAHDLRQIPPGVLALTAGIDTQDEWLAVTLLGWGAPLRPDGPPRLWIIDWHEIRLPQKDTTHEELWDELETWLHLPLVNAWGRPMKILAAGIDSRGHRAREVRAFATRASLRIPVYAVQGATNRMNRPIAQQASDADKSRRGKVHRGAYGTWNVGTEYCKNWIYGQLAADMERGEDERTFTFPGGLPMDYFDGLLSEVYDPEKRRFIQKPGAKYKRNEPIDTVTYAYAIGHHKAVLIGMRHLRDGYANAPAWWARKAAELENAGPPRNPASPNATVPPAPGEPTPSADGGGGRITLNDWKRAVASDNKGDRSGHRA